MPPPVPITGEPLATTKVHPCKYGRVDMAEVTEVHHRLMGREIVDPAAEELTILEPLYLAGMHAGLLAHVRVLLGKRVRHGLSDSIVTTVPTT
jgi:hypothetical protein